MSESPIVMTSTVIDNQEWETENERGKKAERRLKMA